MPPTVFATAADAVEAAKQVAAKDSEHAQAERQLERALQLRREEESSGERSGRPGRVEVGKLEGSAGNAATTAATEGCADVRADRGSWIGNRFEMPPRRHGQGQDERYREPVVAATAHLLAELEAHGKAAVVRRQMEQVKRRAADATPPVRVGCSVALEAHVAEQWDDDLGAS